MPDGLFTFFAALTLGAALLLVLSRNAVTSAMGMILALVGIAADFFLLRANKAIGQGMVAAIESGYVPRMLKGEANRSANAKLPPTPVNTTADVSPDGSTACSRPSP